ncbi:hypothetical protein SODALDRAFT_52296 [Sodiomyces alkalinus F11]|uniref:Major facilitator superfamily (MFS) profile domain-containing protein n=1 Tax=Sodiomyces alkalinus (strain CBS 110278 / VKM F-3762 / F11) TaxID=1314773 RepID=A0A3N2PN33_SODAK|nr:hypothetical protein SODALDRAFT_52296 [Sodiomyces alkalinus F11]ROT35834.1 hypothetical protein SODALDRAFT_52296 [Sodiomyces alkalinus F11]
MLSGSIVVDFARSQLLVRNQTDDREVVAGDSFSHTTSLGALSSRAGVERLMAMLYSFGFELVNIVFCLPAIRTIDTLGRRKWLILTLPVMAVLMAFAAASFAAEIERERTRIVLLAVFPFLFAAALMGHQVGRHLPWLFRRYVLWKNEKRPSLYFDMMWENSDREQLPGERQGSQGIGEDCE